MEVHRTGSRHTFPMAARSSYRHLKRRPFDLIIEDLNKVPLFTPWWVRSPLVLLVHHLFGRIAFQEAPLPIALATWLLERPVPRIYRRLPVLAVSQSTADDLVARGFHADRITVIPNGIDLDNYSPDPAQRFPEPTLLYLGRLKRYKRVDLVLLAFARLITRGVRARLIIAGQGDRADELRQMRDELGLASQVDMPGFVSEAEKRRLLRGAWVHVLTSAKEGWGITNLEAAACGTPTVASNAPGLRDSVIDGETGILVPHGDVEALAVVLGRLIEDAPLRAKLSAGAREFATRFSWDRSADQTEAHLAGVLGLKQRTPMTGQDARSATSSNSLSAATRSSTRRN
jgi:glycosyltransferase involved in cell wall biosynthesis